MPKLTGKIRLTLDSGAYIEIDHKHRNALPISETLANNIYRVFNPIAENLFKKHEAEGLPNQNTN